MTRTQTTVTIEDESDLEQFDDAVEQLRELAEIAATHPDYYLRVEGSIRPLLQPHDED